MTGAPTLRAQDRAARTLDLMAERSARLAAMAERATGTLLAAAAVDDHASWTIPGYAIVTHPDSWTFDIIRGATPIPHEWTQTTMDAYMDVDL